MMAEHPAVAGLGQLRRLAELTTVHRLEGGGEHLAADPHETTGKGLAGPPRKLPGAWPNHRIKARAGSNEFLQDAGEKKRPPLLTALAPPSQNTGLRRITRS